MAENGTAAFEKAISLGFIAEDDDVRVCAYNYSAMNPETKTKQCNWLVRKVQYCTDCGREHESITDGMCPTCLDDFRFNCDMGVM